MKHKYIVYPIFDNIYQDELFLDKLHKLSLKGWKLKSFDPYILKFEKCDHPIYYQIDYNILDDEYKKMTEECGYELIDTYNRISIFATDIPDTLPLYSDEATKKIALLQFYKLPQALLCLALALFFLFPTDLVSFSNIIFNPGEFYLYYISYLATFASIICSNLFFLVGFDGLITRYCIQKDYHYLSSFHTYKKILKWIYPVFEVLFIIILLTILTSFSIKQNILFIIFLVIYLLYQKVINRWTYKIYSKEKRRIFQFISFIICFIITVSLQMYVFDYQEQKPDDLQTYYSYQNHDTYETKRNIFFSNTHIYSHNNSYSESHYVCLNESIASDMYQTLIQEEDRMTRIINNEVDVEINAKGIMIQKIKYNDFQIAIQQFEKVNLNHVDDCYYKDQTVYIRKDNHIFISYVENKENIQDVYQFYLKEFQL